MLTWSGREAAQTISSAMSSPVTNVQQTHNLACLQLTRLETLVDSISRILVASESNDRKFGLDHACCQRVDHLQTLDGPGWISQTRIGVLTSSRSRV